jgi:hypothetical protein
MRDGRRTKPPYQPSGAYASATTPETWTSFETARRAYARGGFAGLGFVVTEEDGFVGVDLDHCRDPHTGAIEPWAQEIVDTIQSYTEVTPSGTGLRIFVRGKLRPHGRKRGNFEIYESGRYLTVTGHHLDSTPMTVIERQAELDAVHRGVFGHEDRPDLKSQPLSPAVLISDDELLEKALKAANGNAFRSLWEGDWEGAGYPSQSEADLALASSLMFWTQNDKARADRIFRRSGLYRKKWDEVHYADGRTYGQETLEKATRHEVYRQGGPAVSPGEKPAREPSIELAPEAYHGVVGDIVRTIEPHTEAHPAAILISFLVAAGNSIGRGPHAIAEADRHGVNLFAVLVGDTAKGRKGSSWGRIRELFKQADPIWAHARIQGGLSSGEGLLWAVRDPLEQTTPVKEKGKFTGDYQTFVTDPGVEDKRLLAYESEFSRVLRVMARDSNILSTEIRQAWDTGDLRTLTKNNPATATGAHISILGHITKVELLHYLNDTEAGNGFGNRFLWVHTRRSKVLPEGGGQLDYQRLVPLLSEALERARMVGRLARDAETREAWAEIYQELSEGKPGLFGAITARAEAQVLRLSVLYAALDGAEAIRLPHLKAALAVWEYSEESARYIFGDATGDPNADRIIEALAYRELSRTDINALFGRNVRSERIDQALNLLRVHGRARFEVRDPSGKGRPSEIWIRT